MHFRRRELNDADTREALLGYLSEFPDAMETLEGIVDWWIGRYQVRADTERVWRALRQLTDAGILEEIGNGAERRYRLKKAPYADGTALH